MMASPFNNKGDLVKDEEPEEGEIQDDGSLEDVSSEEDNSATQKKGKDKTVYACFPRVRVKITRSHVSPSFGSSKRENRRYKKRMEQSEVITAKGSSRIRSCHTYDSFYSPMKRYKSSKDYPLVDGSHEKENQKVHKKLHSGQSSEYGKEIENERAKRKFDEIPPTSSKTGKRKHDLRERHRHKKRKVPSKHNRGCSPLSEVFQHKSFLDPNNLKRRLKPMMNIQQDLSQMSDIEILDIPKQMPVVINLVDSDEEEVVVKHDDDCRIRSIGNPENGQVNSDSISTNDETRSKTADSIWEECDDNLVVLRKAALDSNKPLVCRKQDEDDDVLQLRLEALRSAIVRKYQGKKRIGLTFSKSRTSTLDNQNISPLQSPNWSTSSGDSCTEANLTSNPPPFNFQVDCQETDLDEIIAVDMDLVDTDEEKDKIVEVDTDEEKDKIVDHNERTENSNEDIKTVECSISSSSVDELLNVNNLPIPACDAFEKLSVCPSRDKNCCYETSFKHVLPVFKANCISDLQINEQSSQNNINIKRANSPIEGDVREIRLPQGDYNDISNKEILDEVVNKSDGCHISECCMDLDLSSMIILDEVDGCSDDGKSDISLNDVCYVRNLADNLAKSEKALIVKNLSDDAQTENTEVDDENRLLYGIGGMWQDMEPLTRTDFKLFQGTETSKIVNINHTNPNMLCCIPQGTSFDLNEEETSTEEKHLLYLRNRENSDERETCEGEENQSSTPISKSKVEELTSEVVDENNEDSEVIALREVLLSMMAKGERKISSGQNLVFMQPLSSLPLQLPPPPPPPLVLPVISSLPPTTSCHSHVPFPLPLSQQTSSFVSSAYSTSTVSLCTATSNIVAATATTTTTTTTTTAVSTATISATTTATFGRAPVTTMAAAAAATTTTTTTTRITTLADSTVSNSCSSAICSPFSQLLPPSPSPLPLSFSAYQNGTICQDSITSNLHRTTAKIPSLPSSSTSFSQHKRKKKCVLEGKLPVRINVPKLVINLGEDSGSDDEIIIPKNSKHHTQEKSSNVHFSSSTTVPPDFERKLELLLKEARFQQEVNTEECDTNEDETQVQCETSNKNTETKIISSSGSLRNCGKGNYVNTNRKKVEIASEGCSGKRTITNNYSRISKTQTNVLTTSSSKYKSAQEGSAKHTLKSKDSKFLKTSSASRVDIGVLPSDKQKEYLRLKEQLARKEKEAIAKRKLRYLCNTSIKRTNVDTSPGESNISLVKKRPSGWKHPIRDSEIVKHGLSFSQNSKKKIENRSCSHTKCFESCETVSSGSPCCDSSDEKDVIESLKTKALLKTVSVHSSSENDSGISDMQSCRTDQIIGKVCRSINKDQGNILLDKYVCTSRQEHGDCLNEDERENLSQKLLSSEKRLVDTRLSVLHEIATIRLSLQEMEGVKFIQEQIMGEIQHLREKLKKAEMYMEEKSSLLRILNNHIIKSKKNILKGQSETIMLSSKCEKLGLRIHGPDYTVPDTCADLVHDSMNEVIQQYNTRIQPSREETIHVHENSNEIPEKSRDSRPSVTSYSSPLLALRNE